VLLNCGKPVSRASLYPVTQGARRSVKEFEEGRKSCPGDLGSEQIVKRKALLILTKEEVGERGGG